MLNYPTILQCTQKTAAILFILIGSLFVLAGCPQFYKLLGLSDQQAADQTAADQADRQEIIERVRLTTTEIITTALAGIGAIATGFLTKWLGTEKKINKVLITSIENAPPGSTKETIKARATAAGIESKLHARVKALT